MKLNYLIFIQYLSLDQRSIYSSYDDINSSLRNMKEKSVYGYNKLRFFIKVVLIYTFSLFFTLKKKEIKKGGGRIIQVFFF